MIIKRYKAKSIDELYFFFNSYADLFDGIAYDTWGRIKFVTRSKQAITVSEVTITENLVYHILQYIALEESQVKQEKKAIIISESLNESANGNDLELYIQKEGKDEYIFVPMQAKRIKYGKKKFDSLNDGNYKEIRHKVKGKLQVELLLEYAKKNEGIPMYLLYNYVSNSNLDESYGCTVINATYIKNFIDEEKQKIPTFTDLHGDGKDKGQAVPWSCLLRPKCFEKIVNNYEKKLKNGEQVKGYRYQDISTNNWRDINLSDSYKEGAKLKPDSGKAGNELFFNPKYRMIISKIAMKSQKSK